MSLSLDRNLQAPKSVREAARKLARADKVDERTLLWRRKLQEFTRGEQVSTPRLPGVSDSARS